MKKFEKFLGSLSVLEKAEKELAFKDEIYRTGVIGQFNLTFELAWKALQETLRGHGVLGAENGSPREILKLGFAHSFVNDEETWLSMLKARNLSVHIYSEIDAESLVSQIFDSFISAFRNFSETLSKKIAEIEERN